MTAPTAVHDAFKRLEAKLDKLYGANHILDFENELSGLRVAIYAPPVAVVKPVAKAK